MIINNKKKDYYFISKLTIIFITIFSFNVNVLLSQIGINTEKPSDLTELDIHNLMNGSDTIPKGIIIPRMSQKLRDKISITDKTEANSLMIYNTDEDCFNYYSRTRSEWVSLCGSLGKASFTFDTTNIETVGTYMVGRVLDPTTDYLRITVNVIKPGSYNISATSGNGYTFNGSGQFLDTGTFTIIAQAIGEPTNAGNDEITLTNNGVTIPQKYIITVLPDVGTYSINCENTVVNGVYSVGEALNSSNTITLEITSTNPGSWKIQTDEVEGISFSGSGRIDQAGTSSVTLYGTGTPTNVNTKTLTLTTNSAETQETFCKIKVYVTIPKKTILSIGKSNWAINGSKGGIAAMFSNTNNFGNLAQSKFKTYTPTLLPSENGQLTGTSITSSDLQTYVSPTDGTEPVDIIFITYEGYLNDTVASNLMADYLRRGGVVIMCCENNGYIGQQSLMRNLFNGNASISNNDAIGAGSVLQLPVTKADDMILNGPFGDIRGLYIGEDNGSADQFDTFSLSDADWVVTSTNYNAATVTVSSKVFAMKAKDYNFFFIGDGGAFAYAPNNTSSTTYPAALSPSPNYYPIAKDNYGRNSAARYSVVNSILAANVLAWALRQAEVNGINNNK